MLGQEIKRPTLDSSFVSSTLTNGVPAPLINNGYFSLLEKISYAAVYHDQNDSIYFISKQLSADSNSYVLVLTSNNRIMNYQFLNLKEIEKNKLFATGIIKEPNEKTFEVEIYYLPNEDLISYRVTSVPKTATKNNLHFALGIRDELILMPENSYSFETNKEGFAFRTFLPFNLHLCAGIRFYKYYKVDLRFGLIASADVNYWGFDEGIFFSMLLFNSHFYGTAGIDFFNDYGEGHNSAFSGGNFTFYCLGLGYETSTHFDFDLVYYIPNKEVYGYDINTGYGNPPYGQTHNKKNYGLITLGFQYSFIF
jgi:hypothetical protein